MRIMIVGTDSGCGKTTVTLALMGALRDRGMTVAPYKVGPDYIDTGFHTAVCQRPSHNLDTHLMDENAVSYLLDNDCDISVIEGVMGFYDGMGAVDTRCSSYALARDTGTPAILVVDAAGGAASVAAQVYGFQNMIADNTIAGVIVNRVAGRAHYELARDAVKHYTGLDCVGYLQKDAELALDSRHLGLVPAVETEDLRAKLRRAAGLIAQTVDFEMLCNIAKGAMKLSYKTPQVPSRQGYRLGIARDQAFEFYYQANIDALERAGMELVPFSPLNDSALPEGLDGLYIGGGFPEVFARELNENISMRASILNALNGSMRCYAECGGMMYLSREIDGVAMVGYLPVVCRMTPRLQRFGYVQVEDRTGLRFPAHEFHHAVAEPVEPVDTAFFVRKQLKPDLNWRCGFERGGVLAGFPHLHFLSHPELIARLWP